jgi:hypothetical protein
MSRAKLLSFIIVLAAVAGGVAGSPVRAQETPATVAGAAGREERSLPPLRFNQEPLREVLRRVSQAGNVWVVADSTVGGTLITLETRGGPVARVLGEILSVVPKETQVRLAAVPDGRTVPPGDAVAQYVAAQDGLKGAKRTGYTPGGIPTVPTEIEVAGRAMSREQAAPVLQTLELRPVYLVTNPVADPAVARALRLQAEQLAAWQDMTPEQREKLADQQLAGLLNMEPAARQAFFGQMMQQGMGMFQKIQALPPDQRSQFWKDATGGRWDGTMPPPGSRPGAGGGPGPFGPGGGGGRPN